MVQPHPPFHFTFFVCISVRILEIVLNTCQVTLDKPAFADTNALHQKPPHLVQTGNLPVLVNIHVHRRRVPTKSRHRLDGTDQRR